MREIDTASAWAFNRQFPAPFDAGEKSFSHHYLLYASSGAFHLELAGRHWLLPPHRAALIQSGVQIRIWTQAPVTSASVLFTPSPAMPLDFACRVFYLSELARSMVAYCMRWDKEQAVASLGAQRMFAALADVCLELSSHADDYWLPRAKSRELERALQFTQKNLGEPLRFAEVAAAAFMSERTLARRFSEEITMNWREYVRRARLISAMEGLTQPSATIAQVAGASGFESLSAFNTAFRLFTGETPSGYRRRIAVGAAPPRATAPLA